MVNSIDDLPPLREVIKKYDLRAEKSLGQNFILDQNITDKIVRTAGDLSNVHVIEIGPGPGGLTRSILRAKPAHLTAIEFDPRSIRALQELEMVSDSRMTLLQADALKTDLTQLEPKMKRVIIANLPYNIASSLLIGWLMKVRADASSLNHMTLMFQKEVAERICAVPGTKSYGRLSVMTQWLCHAEILFDIPPSVFVPPPKVISSVIKIVPKTPPADWPEFKVMESLVATAFNQRRKMLRASLKSYGDLLERSDIDGTKRAENLEVQDYIALAKMMQSS